MRRIPALLLLALLALAVLTACGGGNNTLTTFGPPTTITMTPATTSLTLGAFENANVIVQDDKTPANTLYSSVANGAVSSASYTSSNSEVLQVANNGLICAGKWDSLTTPVVCTPGQVGSAVVTAKYTTLSTTATFYVHQAVDALVVSTDATGCASQNTAAAGQTATPETQIFSVKAFSHNTEITDTIGPVTWTSSATNVATATSNFTSTNPVNTATVKAVNPGITNITASTGGAGGVQSTAATFETCPIVKLDAHVATKPDTAVTLDTTTTTTATLQVDATDSKGNAVVFQDTTSLTWTSLSTPTATITTLGPATGATVTSNTATLTAKAAGISSIVASCIPPACNTGLTPIYSNAVAATVGGTPAATTVYAASTTGTSLIPIDTGTNTAATAITLPASPNSMVFDRTGSKIFLGSTTGLIIYDLTANTVSTGGVAPGRIIALAPNGNRLLTTDGTKAYIFETNTGLVSPLNVAGVTAGAFSSDSSVAYLVGNGNVTAVTATPIGTVSRYTPRTTGLAGGNAVDFLANGALAYVAAGATPVFATCQASDTTLFGVPLQTVATSGATLVRATPDNTKMIVAAPPNVEAIPVTGDFSGCPAQATNSTPVTVSAGAYTPLQLLVTQDSKLAVIITDQPQIISYDIVANTVTPIPLTGGATPFNGGITVAKQLYVGGSDKAVHLIDLTTNADTKQITLTFTPDLVVVRPK